MVFVICCDLWHCWPYLVFHIRTCPLEKLTFLRIKSRRSESCHQWQTHLQRKWRPSLFPFFRSLSRQIGWNLPLFQTLFLWCKLQRLVIIPTLSHNWKKPKQKQYHKESYKVNWRKEWLFRSIFSAPNWPLILPNVDIFIFCIGKEAMASVPISRAYVWRLTKRTERGTTHEHCNIQMNDVKEQRRSFFQSVGYLRRISATCTSYDQAIRIHIEKDVSNNLQE